MSGLSVNVNTTRPVLTAESVCLSITTSRGIERPPTTHTSVSVSNFQFPGFAFGQLAPNFITFKVYRVLLLYAFCLLFRLVVIKLRHCR